MKTYTGTKTIHAKPMTRGEYSDYRNWTLPADENGADEGYLVEYTDGGKANDSRHAGYISWSPREQFEKAYVDIGDVSGMPPHLQRVVAEKAEIEGRLQKLGAFIGGEVWRKLDHAEQVRLAQQGTHMAAYNAVLYERIAAASDYFQLGKACDLSGDQPCDSCQ